MPREPLRPATDVTLMILPARCRIITRPAACAKRNTPVRFVAIIASHSDRGRSSSGERIRVAGVVDQDIDAPELVQSLRDGAVDPPSVTDVALDDERAASLGANEAGDRLQRV